MHTRKVTGVLIGAIACAVPTASAIASSSRSLPDVQRLYGTATRHVRHADHGSFAKAVLYEAQGTTADGRGVSTAAGITRWKFVFDNPTPNSPYAYVTVSYGPPPKAFGRVRAYKTPFLEDSEIPRAPKISLRRAVALLHRAGDRGTFRRVTLRNPITPPFDGPRYIFTFVKSGAVTYIAVSARTGKVTRQR